MIEFIKHLLRINGNKSIEWDFTVWFALTLFGINALGLLLALLR